MPKGWYGRSVGARERLAHRRITPTEKLMTENGQLMYVAKIFHQKRQNSLDGIIVLVCYNVAMFSLSVFLSSAKNPHVALHRVSL